MKEKRSKASLSKIDRGSNSKQLVETPFELEQDGHSWLLKHSRSFPLQGFLGKPKYSIASLAIIIVIVGIGKPILLRLITANLDIRPIIHLAIISLVSTIVSYVLVKFLPYMPLWGKTTYLLARTLFMSFCLIVSGTLAFVFLPFLIQLITSTLGIPEWLSAVIILICPITFISEGRFRKKVYGLQRLNLPLYVVF